MSKKNIVLIVTLIIILIGGGIAAWQMWPKKGAPTPPSTTVPASTTTQDSLNKLAAKEVVTNFLKAKQSRNLENAKPFLDPEFAKTFNQVEFAGTSNPHMGCFEIQSAQLSPDRKKYSVKARVYSEYTGEGEIGYSDNTYYVKPAGNRYLIYKIEYGKYIELPVNETADRKTYRNKEYGFEIKYPKDFEINQKVGEIVLSSVKASSPEIDLYVQKNLSVPLNGTFGGRMEYNLNTPPKAMVLHQKASQESGNFNKDYFVAYGGMGSWDTVINSYVKHRDNYYIVSLVYPFINDVPGMVTANGTKMTREKLTTKALGRMRDENNEYVKTFNRMLSTFKFIK